MERVTEQAPRFFVCILVGEFRQQGSRLAMFVNGIGMNILQNNPYRLLGVFSNSPTKERLANCNRMKAFLKVGKFVSFPLDLPQYLSPISRTEALVVDAEAKLTLPKEQMLYAQFWFVKLTPLDDVAFNHLVAGELPKAVEIWKKKECVASLQNRVVSALISGDYAGAMSCAEILYGNTQYVNEFVSAVVGDGGVLDATALSESFLHELCDVVGANKLLRFITNSTWKSHIVGKTVKPLVDDIQEAIDVAKKTKGKDSSVRLDAGKSLMAGTKNALGQLRSLLATSDIQYQTVADKLGLEILQCGIDYYNASEEPDAAKKAMVLQSYALSVVVGQMAKDRCKKNVDILRKIIDNQPPSVVFSEDRAICEELRKYCLLPDKICHAVMLLNNTKPYVQSIKRKLGVSNSYYIKISTQIVGNALSNIIAEVNEVQSKYSADEDSPNARSTAILGILCVKSVLEEAWKATRIMDGFDMDVDYRSGRYSENRSILIRLCDQLGVPTSTDTSKKSLPQTTQSKPTSAARPYSSTTNRTFEDRQTTSSSSSSSSSFNSSSDNGCLIAFIVWVFFGCIAGSICAANDGDFSAGFCIAGVLLIMCYGLFNQ